MTTDRAELTDKSRDRTYFTMIPNMLWEIGLTCFDRELYSFLKRTAGENGVCWKSMRTIAKETGISLGQVDKSRDALVANGLIECEKRKHVDGGWMTWHVCIIDIWQRNMEVMAAKRSRGEQSESVHGMNEVFTPRTKCSQDDAKCSLHDDKEEPIKKNQEDIKSGSAQTDAPIIIAPKKPTAKERALARISEMDAQTQPYVDAYLDGDTIEVKSLAELRQVILANTKALPPVEDFRGCVRFKRSDAKFTPYTPAYGFKTVLNDYSTWCKRGRPTPPREKLVLRNAAGQTLDEFQEAKMLKQVDWYAQWEPIYPEET